MDGSMWYEKGGGGIFKHWSGPYAGPNPVSEALGFAGLAGDEAAAVELDPAIPFSPEEAAAAAQATADLIRRLQTEKSSGMTAAEKDNLDDLIQEAQQWGREQMNPPWYKRTTVWACILGGVAVVGAGVGAYVLARRRAA